MKSIANGLMAALMLLSVTVTAAQEKQSAEGLTPVFQTYFELKDALTKSDSKSAATESSELLSAIKSVKMESLNPNEHTTWMKVMKDLAADAEMISGTTEIGHQRDHFVTLSKNIYELQKVSKTQTPVYYQFCPMANKGKGANWLSKEKTVKNPYYGSQMLTCGKVVETIN